ncbi:MAG: hypothetical protein HY925_07725 [Elusimicrobia bacterium]|nr:hypothetical protein [Elusimicrobiota bacterium]
MLIRRSEEQGLEFGVSPETGGELASLKVRRGSAWKELLFRAEDLERRKRGLWRGRCPWLFPAVGRNYLPDQLRRVAATGADEVLGSWALKGKPLAMPMHGFAMNKVWEPLGGGAADVACRLENGPDGRLFYPFDFELVARYGFLDEGGVYARLEVSASDRNEGPMPFSVGNHLTLALKEARLRTPAKKAFDLSRQSLLAGTSRAAGLEEPIKLEPRSPLLNAVIGDFDWEEAWVELDLGEGLIATVSQHEVVQTAVPFTSPEHYYFVFWGDLEAGFFCPEPWYGGPNSLNDRRGVVELAPGARFSWELRLRLKT